MTENFSAGFMNLMKMVRMRAGRQSDFFQMRKGLDAFGSFFTTADVKMRAVEICGRPAEWFFPPEERRECVLLYLHGGGYVTGSIQSHRHLASRIAVAAQLRTLIVDYRLAPEHPFPAALDDVANVYEFLLGKGGMSNRVVLVGDSAGGGLCVSLMVRLKQKKMMQPNACVCLSPWVDLAMKGDSWMVNADSDDFVKKDDADRMACAYLNDANPCNPVISSVYADLSGLPTMLIHVGSKEVLLDDAIALHRQAQLCGVNAHLEIYENMPHVWHFMAPFLREGQEAIDRIADFLRRCLEET